MTLGRYQFVRSHGLGNDYLVVDGARFGLRLDEQAVRQLCDRHRGLGSDGILVLDPPPAGCGAAVRIFNPDGSEAEKSGNGVRIFAKFCFDHGYADPASRLEIHTLGGRVVARQIAREASRSVLRVSMGRASFRCADLPMDGGGVEEWVERPLDVGGRAFNATCLSMGNPHAVLFDAPFDEESTRRVGPLVETHARFPRRTNVQLVKVESRETVRALIWERGAGWTLSSGSSACAVAAACVRAGLVEREIDVVMPGGTLRVAVTPSWEIEQTGAAQEIALGTVSGDLISDLGG